MFLRGLRSQLSGPRAAAAAEAAVHDMGLRWERASDGGDVHRGNRRLPGDVLVLARRRRLVFLGSFVVVLVVINQTLTV